MTEISENAEDAFENAAAQGIALKRAYPAGRDAERVRDAALIQQAGRLVAAAREVITASRANGGNGHAPALAKPAEGERLTKEQLRTLAHGLRGWLDPELRALEKRLLTAVARELGKEFAERDRRIAALEARPVLEDGDVWNERTLYRKGVVVTRDGSAWVCREPNSNAMPGQSDCWRLWVKRGRDGRDAKGTR